MEFKDKVAVITGGASGIGESLAKELAKLGTRVVIADSNESNLHKVQADIAAAGGQVLAIACDVAKDEDVTELARRTLDEIGRTDILINNAGVMLRGLAESIPMEDWEWILGINLFGVIRGVRAFLPHMLERGSSHIVNTSSIDLLSRHQRIGGGGPGHCHRNRHLPGRSCFNPGWLAHPGTNRCL